MLNELQIANNRLKKLQDKLLCEAIKLDKELLKRVADKNDFLFDYEIEIEISFYLKENEENIFSTIEEYLKNISLNKDKDIWKWSENHNEFFGRTDHFMKNEYHCWWFHCLYDHNNLGFEEILKIGKIWSDIKVYYQYLEE
jgi:hypothetical protein